MCIIDRMKAAFLVVVVLHLAAACFGASFDLVIKNGRVVDGTGTAAFAAPASSARIGIMPMDCRRATAAGVLEASSTPSCTSPAGVTALY